MLDIVKKAENYADALLSSALDAKYLYHNLQHTHRVVKSTKELLNAISLTEKEKEWLVLAAWLHDLGYTKTYA
ncbi:MAG: HD domain-containing protein, partial [Flavobacteriaceae bacterium]